MYMHPYKHFSMPTRVDCLISQMALSLLSEDYNGQHSNHYTQICQQLAAEYQTV